MRRFPDEVRQDFLQRVESMAVIPYLREGVQRLSAQMQVGNVTVPVIRIGEVRIDTSSQPQGS